MYPSEVPLDLQLLHEPAGQKEMEHKQQMDFAKKVLGIVTVQLTVTFSLALYSSYE